MSALDNLKAAVDNNTATVTAAVAAIQAHADDTAALEQLTQTLTADNTRLQDAITAASAAPA